MRRSPALIVLAFAASSTQAQDADLPPIDTSGAHVDPGQDVTLTPIQDPDPPAQAELDLGAPPPSSGFFFSDWDPSRPDATAPPALRYTQTARPGSWLFSYRYQRRDLDGLRDGRDDLSSNDLFAVGFDTVPESMQEEVHTIEALYGWDESWTLFATVPYIRREMDNLTLASDRFTTEMDGVGDVVVGGIYDWDSEGTLIKRLHLGLGIPTGSIDEMDRDETGAEVVLPYPMQPGTGTFDLYPGFVVMEQRDSFTWGFYGQARIHLDRNDDDWAVGDTYRTSAWAAYPFTESLSGQARIEGFWWGDYHGETTALDPTSNPIEDANRQGGDRIDVHAGLNYEIGDGLYSDNRIAVEFGVPVDEWLDGPNLSTEWLLTFGWQLSY